MPANHIDQLTRNLAAMDRPALIKMLRSLCCQFELDFSDEYLNSLPLERLRHITLAVGLRAHNEHIRFT